MHRHVHPDDPFRDDHVGDHRGGGRHRRSQVHRRGPGRHGPGGHRARRGAVAAGILALLDERPMHGYELISELEERSGGRWRPSPGAIYPALAKLEESGLIETADAGEGKKTFSLTDAGRRRVLEDRALDDGEPWQRAGVSRRGDVRRVVAELVGPARQIMRFGTAEQVERARATLQDATRRLYEILASPAAEDEQQTSPDEPRPDPAG